MLIETGSPVLTSSQLVALHRALEAERVLSAYIDFSSTDPAERQSWKKRLDHALADIRTWLADASPAERATAERCIAHLERAIAEAEPQSSMSWCAFVTEAGVYEAHTLPLHVPTLAIWSNGASIAPYLRVLRDAEPVVVAVADSREVELYRYMSGMLTKLESVHAHHAVDAASHMGAPAQQGFHSGTRGTTGHDAAQRSLQAGRDHMLDLAAERIAAAANTDAWVAIGGIPTVAAHLAERCVQLGNRLTADVSLDVHATHAQITAAARTAARALRDAHDLALIADLADLESTGLATRGDVLTTRALDETRVRDLFVSTRYLDEKTADAELAVRAALEQGAEVSLVSGDAAAKLDDDGGIGARLRYRTQHPA